MSGVEQYFFNGAEDQPLAPEEPIDREAEWKEGRHYTSDGVVLKLSEMNDRHLHHAIMKWSGVLDVSSLKAEAERRSKKKK